MRLVSVGILIKNGGRFDHCPKLSEIYHSFYVAPPSGIRQTPTTVPHLPVPLHCTIPVRSTPPPNLFLCMQRPPHATCLSWCMPCPLYRSFVFYKVPLGPWNHRSPRGAYTLLGPDSIYQIPLWFLVTLVTKLQPMPNHWSHSLDSGSFT